MVAVMIKLYFYPLVLASVLCFEANKEYSFHYESQVVSGIQDAGRYWSVLKIEATCKLQMHQDNVALAKLFNIRIYTSVDELSDSLHPHDPLPMDRMHPQYLPDLVEQLEKPIKFRYTNGYVENLECEAGDPFWTINIKRGLLNVLQVKLEKPQNSSHEQQEEHHEIAEAYQSNDVRAASDEEMFDIKEEGIEGTCRTIYTLQNTRPGVMKVMKVKDIEDCDKRPSYYTGILSMVVPQQCEQRKTFIKTLADAEYDVRVTSSDYIINEAVYRSQHLMHPVDSKHGVLTSHTLQKLKYTGVRQGTTFDIAHPLLLMNTFKMDIFVDFVSQDQHHEQQERSKEEQKQKMKSLISEILRASRPTATMEAVYLMEDAMEVMRETSEVAILELADSLKTQEMNLLTDLISAEPSAKAASLMKNLTNSGLITELRALYLFASYSLVAHPSPLIVPILLPWCTREVRCSEPLKTVVLLTAGTVMNKMYRMRNILDPRLVQSTIADAHSVLTSLYAQAEFVHEKNMYIRALGNAGIPGFLPNLQNIITNKTEHPVVRKTAIHALRKLTDAAQSEIQQTLLPVYLNTSEPAEVRMACVALMMQTKPSLSFMSIITAALNSEPNIEVASFVFTHISALATRDCMLDTYQKAKIALLLAKPVPPKHHGSTYTRYENILDGFNIGAFLDKLAAKYENTILPNEFVTKIGGIWEKLYATVYEGGVEIRGLQELETLLIGENGVLWKVLRNQITPREAMEKVLEWILGVGEDSETDGNSWENRGRRDKLDMIRVSLFMRLWDSDVFHVDDTNEEYSQLGSLVGEVLDAHISHLFMDDTVDSVSPLTTLRGSIIVPSAVGLPLSFNRTFLTITSSQGTQQFHGSFYSDEYNFTANTHHSAANLMMAHVGVYLPMLKVGHGLVGKTVVTIPLNYTAQINTHDLSVAYTWRLPEQEFELLNWMDTPVGYWKRLPCHSSDCMHRQENRVQGMYGVSQIDAHSTPAVLGLRADIKHQYVRPTTDNIHLLPLFAGKNALKVTIRPEQHQPAEEIEFRAALLCPTCPMTDSQKHEFLFGPNYHQQQGDIQAVDEERSWGSWWGRSSRREQRLSSDVSFDEVQPDTSLVDPRLNYKLAFVCKTKQATEQKIIGAQVCVMLNSSLRKYQIDTQLITPAPFSQQLKKIKLITKISLPEYLFHPNSLIREGKKTLVHKTEVYIGKCHNPTKQCVIETKLSKLPYQWRDIPAELTPVKLETKVSEMRRIPSHILNQAKQYVTFLETLSWKVLNNYIRVHDIIDWKINTNGTGEQITLETRWYPTELKGESTIQIENDSIKIEVCPYKLPWSVPMKPITYENLPSIHEHHQQQEENSQWDDSQDESCERRLLTKKLRRTIEDEVCFSIEPVYTCKGACRRPEQYDRQQVEFTCMSRSSARAQRLISESLQRPLYDLRYESRDLVHEVPIPVYCEA